MINYRRVYTSSSKFKRIQNWTLPFWVNGRLITVMFYGFVFSAFIGYFAHWFTLENAKISWFLILLTVVEIIIYLLEVRFLLDGLKFEQSMKYMIKYLWEFKIKKNQVYQDKHSNTNQKVFQIK